LLTVIRILAALCWGGIHWLSRARQLVPTIQWEPLLLTVIGILAALCWGGIHWHHGGRRAQMTVLVERGRDLDSSRLYQEWESKTETAGMTIVIQTTAAELFSLFSLLLWKNLEAHCFHSFLTDSPTEQSEKSKSSELPDPSKTVKIAETVLFSLITLSIITKCFGTRVTTGSFASQMI